MTEREKGFPWFPIIVGGLMVLYGSVWAMRGQADWISGWSMGFGIANIVCILMVWASPMNEKRK